MHKKPTPYWQIATNCNLSFFRHRIGCAGESTSVTMKLSSIPVARLACFIMRNRSSALVIQPWGLSSRSVQEQQLMPRSPPSCNTIVQLITYSIMQCFDVEATKTSATRSYYSSHVWLIIVISWQSKLTYLKNPASLEVKIQTTIPNSKYIRSHITSATRRQQ